MKTTQQLAIAIFTATVIISCSQNKSNSEHAADAIHSEGTSVLINSSEDALAELKNGNLRFLKGEMINTDYKKQIEHTRDHQYPHSIILSCIDSRVPPEILFDQGIGNIFVARVAGNIEDPNILGSLEFATKVKGSKLIVVMGHNKCGAIKGAIENADLGHLTQLVQQISPSIKGDTTDIENMHDQTSKNNIKFTIADILKSSTEINALVNENKLKIIGAYYDVTNGEVTFLD